MSDGAWHPDPGDQGQFRWWDGQQWTEHVRPAADADPAAASVQALVAQVKAEKLAKHSAKTDAKIAKATAAATATAEQVAAAHDPSVVWQGTRKSMSSAATGLSSGSYKLTGDMLYFEAGMMSSKSEQIPLWSVRDVDISQTISQKARGVGDVTIRCQHNDYTGRPMITMESIEEPRRVRDLMNITAAAARLRYQEHQARLRGMHYQPQVVVHSAPAVAAPAGPPTKDLVTQLRELAELRDAAILTDAEFETQKARLLG